jgi:hypothetical protein
MLQTVLAELDAIIIPTLERPPVPWNDKPAGELLVWAVRFYVGAVLGHARELLRGFLLLGHAGLLPASLVIARALLELAGVVALVTEKVSRSIEVNDTERAGTLLLRATMGNRYMSDRGTKVSDGSEWVKPFNVLDGIRAIDEKFPGDGSRKATNLYDSLSEVCHPNMGALFQHYRIEDADVRFDDPPHETDTSPIEEVELALMVLVYSLLALSSIAGDRARAHAFETILVGTLERVRERPKGNMQRR